MHKYSAFYGIWNQLEDIFTISMILFAVIDIVEVFQLLWTYAVKWVIFNRKKATIVAAVIMIAFYL